MARRTVVLACIAVVAALIGVGVPAASAPSEPLRLNHFQAKGSHNSYHIELPQDVIDIYYAVAADQMPWLLQYTHEPLTKQFENLGVRQIELDLYADPAGDRVYPPVGVPGWKVAHIEEVDMGSTCPLLIDCLQEIETWSDRHPSHIPIAVLLELKDSDDFPLGPNVPVFIDAALLHDLDGTIRSVFGDDDLVTPDFVRGVGRPGGADGAGTVYPDPESAILGEGWPLLDDVRGRVMFVLDNKRDEYVDGDPTLAGRVAFSPSSPGNPDAAFVKLNDPVGSFAQIQWVVNAGYMVRTRGDLPVETGLTKDDTQLQAALASGAHWVSGDYLTPTDHERYDQAFADRYAEVTYAPVAASYETVIPGGTPARCNPITAPPGCASTDVEDLTAAEMPPATEPEDEVVPVDAGGGEEDRSPVATRRPASATPARTVAASPAFTG